MRLPQLGMGMTEGDIVKWLVKEGDVVEMDTGMAQIETEKVNVELKAPFAGVVRKILAKEGTVVGVGTVIALIGESDEPIPQEFIQQ